jgi:probable HAF family extracellular repeat protein
MKIDLGRQAAIWAFSMTVALLQMASVVKAAPAAPRYTVTDMGNLGGEESVAYAINDQGQLVGGADTGVRGRDGEFVTSIYLWSQGVKHKISALPGRHYYATGINDKGQIVGAYSARPEGAIYIPFLYDHGAVHLLGVLHRSGGPLAISAAQAINEEGMIVGISNGEAFTWKNGRMLGLPMPHGFTMTTAFAVNDHGWSAGSGVGPGGAFFRSHALLWRDGKVTDLGTLPGYGDIEAHGINNAGQVIGWANRRLPGGSPLYRAFLWQNGRMRDLGTLPGINDTRANAINNQGDVVGRIVGHVARKGDERACLWRGGHLSLLNAAIPPHSGWVLEEALAINDHGWIIGNGKHNGVARAFLLRPAK